MEQLELPFDEGPDPYDLPFPPGSRRDDWDTSKAAEKMISAKRTTNALAILRAYRYVDRTDEEAAEVARLLHSCYWKRSSELREMGLIEPTGATRKGRAGTGRIVCQITDRGKWVLDEHRRRQAQSSELP